MATQRALELIRTILEPETLKRASLTCPAISFSPCDESWVRTSSSPRSRPISSRRASKLSAPTADWARFARAKDSS